jgi:hypothetical protein
MAWFNWLGGIFKGGKEVAEVFVENRENKGQRIHDENMADIGRDMASLQQFSSEFHQRANRTSWDSFVDGLNRLPRPIITISVLGFFVLTPLYPSRFLDIAEAYGMMPAGYWALLSVIIGFYFGGRMQLTSQDMTVKKDALQAAKDLVAMKQEFRKLEAEEESAESKMFEEAIKSGIKMAPNKIIAEWLKER